jgi:hypothetical protein
LFLLAKYLKNKIKNEFILKLFNRQNSEKKKFNKTWLKSIIGFHSGRGERNIRNMIKRIMGSKMNLFWKFSIAKSENFQN